MNLIERLNKAIDVEYDSKNNELDELLSLPLEVRVQKGEAIADITATFIPWMEHDGNIFFTKVQISCNENISKFREGSRVALRGHTWQYSTIVIEDNGETMLLENPDPLWGSPYAESSLNNLSDWHLISDKVDLRDVVKKSTFYLQLNKAKFEVLNGIFEGTILPELPPTGARLMRSWQAPASRSRIPGMF
jgi:hypothetical protein